jgi:hypothetical protein
LRDVYETRKFTGGAAIFELIKEEKIEMQVNALKKYKTQATNVVILLALFNHPQSADPSNVTDIPCTRVYIKISARYTSSNFSYPRGLNILWRCIYPS